jgi:hypothetical protein
LARFAVSTIERANSVMASPSAVNRTEWVSRANRRRPAAFQFADVLTDR